MLDALASFGVDSLDDLSNHMPPLVRTYFSAKPFKARCERIYKGRVGQNRQRGARALASRDALALVVAVSREVASEQASAAWCFKKL